MNVWKIDKEEFKNCRGCCIKNYCWSLDRIVTCSTIRRKFKIKQVYKNNIVYQPIKLLKTRRF